MNAPNELRAPYFAALPSGTDARVILRMGNSINAPINFGGQMRDLHRGARCPSVPVNISCGPRNNFCPTGQRISLLLRVGNVLGLMWVGKRGLRGAWP
mgnify:CR=1 FL=1